MLNPIDLFGPRDLVDEAISFLKANCPPEGYYVAFSGGKDSIVALDLVRRAGVKHDVHMNLTSVDPIELLRFVREHYPDIDFVKPKQSMAQLIIRKGFPPTRIMRYCCGYLKEQSAKGRYLITGVRAQESAKRSKYKMIEPDIKRKTTIHVRPIFHWSSDDVWEYIEKNNLPYPSLYDEGWSRIGCIMCPMTGKAGMLRDAARWPHVYNMYKGACQKAIDRRLAQGNPLTQKSGQEMMDWWIHSQK